MSPTEDGVPLSWIHTSEYGCLQFMDFYITLYLLHSKQQERELVLLLALAVFWFQDIGEDTARSILNQGLGWGFKKAAKLNY